MTIYPQRPIRYISCLVLGSVFRVGGSNGAVSGYIKSKMAAGHHLGKIRSQIAAEWLQISQRSQWRAYSKPPSLFRMVPSPTLYDPFPKMGFHINPRYANGHISATGDQIHFMFVTRLGFSSCFGHYNRSCLLTYLLSGSADRMALFPVTSSWQVGSRCYLG